MQSLDLHQQFLNALFDKFSKKSILTNIVSEILHIEKESAYRRLTGKVNFSVREMGIVAKKLGISIDKLTNTHQDRTWFPFQLENPLQSSIDVLFHIVGENLNRIEHIAKEPALNGNIYNSLPIEFYLYSPVLTKFMFFKWGHYFVGGTEFNDYRCWELPQQLDGLHQKVKDIMSSFRNIYYIWDDAVIWTHLNEIENLYKMRVINKQDKNELKQAFKDMLVKLEHSLSGIHDDQFDLSPDTLDFYICSRSSGFSCNYYMSENEQEHYAFFQTNYSHCVIEDDFENFNKLRNWVDSFKCISTMLSRSGRVERRIFFDTQLKLIDLILDND